MVPECRLLDSELTTHRRKILIVRIMVRNIPRYELIMVIGFQNGLHHHLPDPIVGTIQLGILRKGRKGGNMHGLVVGKELGSIRLVNGKELVSIVIGGFTDFRHERTLEETIAILKTQNTSQNKELAHMCDLEQLALGSWLAIFLAAGWAKAEGDGRRLRQDSWAGTSKEGRPCLASVGGTSMQERWSAS